MNRSERIIITSIFAVMGVTAVGFLAFPKPTAWLVMNAGMLLLARAGYCGFVRWWRDRDIRAELARDVARYTDMRRMQLRRERDNPTPPREEPRAMDRRLRTTADEFAAGQTMFLPVDYDQRPLSHERRAIYLRLMGDVYLQMRLALGGQSRIDHETHNRLLFWVGDAFHNLPAVLEERHPEWNGQAAFLWHDLIPLLRIVRGYQQHYPALRGLSGSLEAAVRALMAGRNQAHVRDYVKEM